MLLVLHLLKIQSKVVGVGTFSYTISTSSTSSSSVTEGSDITVTITRNISGGNPGESTIYLNTTAGTADESDYTAQKATAINFTNLDTDGATKTVTIKTSTDAFTESKEYFYVDLFKSKADANDGYPYFDFCHSLYSQWCGTCLSG